MPLFRLILCLILSFIPKLSATESSRQSPVFTMEGLPSTIVNGTVNIISGDYCESEIDLIVPGAEPISIGRSHSSAAMEMSTLYQGWSSNQFSLMEIHKNSEQPNRKQPAQAIFRSPSGAIVCLSSKDFNTQPLEIDIGKHSRGLTNCGQGLISAQTNLKNTILRKSPLPAPFEISTGDGSTFCYKPIYNLNGPPMARLNGQYWPSQQQLPNKNKFLYEYNHIPEPTRITAKNASETESLAWVEYHTHADSKRKIREVCIKGSNKRELKYTLLNSRLSKVESPHIPETQYSYEDRPGMAFSGLITKRDRPENRFLITEYYGVKANKVGDGPLISLGNDDLRLKRVKLQMAPVGHDSTPIIISRFFYNVKREFDHKCGRGKAVEGSTEVYDALNNKSIYHYDKHQRLTQIEVFETQANKSYTFKRRELFFWGDMTSVNAGNLLSKAVQDEQSQTLACSTYKYDNKGNISKETQWGNLSGRQKVNILLDGNGTPTNRNIESYSIRYTYSNDDRNLMLTKLEDNGIKTEHIYKEDTNLLSEKYLYEGEQLRVRNYFQYSSFGALTECIVDDGTTRDPNSLKGVSTRKLTSIQLRKKSPGFGQAELISEYGLDLSKNQVKLITKTAKSYNAHDLVEQECFYDSNGKKVYTLDKSYDERDRLINGHDSRGKTFQYKYDANGNRVYSQGPSNEFHTLYTYDFSNRLIGEKEIHKNKQVFSKSFRYDYLSNQISSTDIYGNETDYKHDVFGNITEITSPQVLNEKDRAYRPVEKFSYDVFGNRTSETNPMGHVSRTEYNSRGAITASYHPDGTYEYFLYNLDGTLKQKTERNGSFTSFERNFSGEITAAKIYSSKGRLLKTLRNSYSSFNKLSSTDGEGHSTYYKYDYAGRLCEEASGEKKLSYEFDSKGQVSRILSKYANGRNDYSIISRDYDVFARVIKEAQINSQGQELLKQTFLYDLNGNKTHETSFSQAGAATTLTEYNSFNKPIKVVDALGNSTHISYSFTDRNRLGQKIASRTVVDVNGKITLTIGDALLRVVEFQQKDSRGSCLDKRLFHYDGAGNKTSDTHHVYGNNKKLYSVSTCWGYDPGKLLIKLTEAKGTREQKITSYSYNNNSQLEHSWKPNGVKISRAYDSLGRLHHINSSDGSIHDEYSYNTNNQVTNVYDHVKRNSTLRTYDSYSRISSETLANGLQLGYFYDLHDRPSKVTLPDASSIAYHYDATFLREVSRHSASGACQYTHKYTSYDQAGNLLQATPITENQNISQRWDKLGRCTQMSQEHHSWNIPKKGFDPVGNLKNIEVTDVIGPVQSNFAYNSRYQLKSETGVAEHKYDYDSRNNRLNKDEKTYQHNRVDSLLHDGAATYSYDACGNLTKKKLGDKEINYRYDAFDRLISVTEHEFLAVHYEYDAFHRRTSKHVSKWNHQKSSWVKTSDLLFLYQGDNEIGASDLDRKIIELRVLGSGRGAEIAAAVAIELDGHVYAPIHDHRGSLAALVDKDIQNIVESYRYSAFGEEEVYDEEQNLMEDSAIGNPWRYSSKRVEEESGLVFFGRRYYSPDIGRWITTDPAGFKDGPNLYAYVAGSPLRYFDLYGLKTETENATLRDTKCGRTVTHGRNINLSTKKGGRVITHHNVYTDITGPKSEINKLLALVNPAGNKQDRLNSRANNYYLKSGKGETSDKVRTMFTPGQLSRLKDARTFSELISGMHGGSNIHTTTNPTGGLLNDLGESIAYRTFNIETEVIVAFVNNARNLIDEMGGTEGGGTLRSLTFSQGAIIERVGSGLMSHQERQMLQCHDIAPGCINSTKMAGDVTSYVSKFDPVPYTDIRGMMSSNSNVQFLTPGPGAIPGMDHGIFNSTYRPVWERIGFQFINQYGAIQ